MGSALATATPHRYKNRIRIHLIGISANLVGIIYTVDPTRTGLPCECDNILIRKNKYG